MKKQIYLFILLTLTASCSEKKLKEDVIQAIEENMDEVESYYIEQHRDTKFVNLSDDNDVQEAGGTATKVNVVEDPLQISGQLFDNDQWAEYYITEEAMYEKIEGEDWENTMEKKDASTYLRLQGKTNLFLKHSK